MKPGLRNAFAFGLSGLASGCALAAVNVEYVCDSGAHLKVSFLESSAELHTPDGHMLVLQQQRSADGFSYSYLGMELRGKGRDVTLAAPPGAGGGVTEHCRATPASAPQPVSTSTPAPATPPAPKR